MESGIKMKEKSVVSVKYGIDKEATWEDVRDITKFFQDITLERVSQECGEIKETIKKGQRKIAALIVVSAATILSAIALLKMV